MSNHSKIQLPTSLATTLKELKKFISSWHQISNLNNDYLPNKLIYLSNHLPHELATLSKRIETFLKSQPDINNTSLKLKQMILEVFDTNKVQLDPYISQQLSDPNSSIQEILKILNDYLKNELYTAAELDTLCRTQEIKDLQNDMQAKYKIFFQDIRATENEIFRNFREKFDLESTLDIDLSKQIIQNHPEKIMAFIKDKVATIEETDKDLEECQGALDEKQREYESISEDIKQLYDNNKELTSKIADLKIKISILQKHKEQINIMPARYLVKYEETPEIKQLARQLESLDLELENALEADRINKIEIRKKEKYFLEISKDITLRQIKIELLKNIKQLLQELIDNSDQITALKLKQEITKVIRIKAFISDDRADMSIFQNFMNNISEVAKFFSVEDNDLNQKNIQYALKQNVCGSSYNIDDYPDIDTLRKGIISYSYKEFLRQMLENSLIPSNKSELTVSDISIDDTSTERSPLLDIDDISRYVTSAEQSYFNPKELGNHFAELIALASAEVAKVILPRKLAALTTSIKHAATLGEISKSSDDLYSSGITYTPEQIKEGTNDSIDNHEQLLDDLGQLKQEATEDLLTLRTLAENLFTLVQETQNNRIEKDDNLKRRYIKIIQLANELKHKLCTKTRGNESFF